MAADVSSLFRSLSGFSDDRMVTNEIAAGKSQAPVTRDLLGGSPMNDEMCHEIDLDSQVPNGWEKRLDLKSGKVYLRRCNSSSSTDHNQAVSMANHHDLNFPPSQSKITLNLFDESHLDLKLVSSLPSSSSSRNYQSVCTLDKVKIALERAEKDPVKKRSSLFKSSISPSNSSSSTSIRENQEQEVEDNRVDSPIAAGCPGCLSYVLILKNNPKCPRCNSVVPLPPAKKPRIDLNMAI